MSKLNVQDRFLDLSDYGRPVGRFIANQLKDTTFTPVHVTFLFGFSGLLAVYSLLQQHWYWAGFFILLKSCIDAADGELARLKNTPSYFGRYLDSVFDFILNFMLLMSICFVSRTNLVVAVIAFICLQLQGTLYNYYYVILRTRSLGGDSTSKIFEYKAPKALPGESQKSVNMLFGIYTIAYGLFDKVIHLADPNAYRTGKFPNWFMTLISLYGLGFQLLIITVMLALQMIDWILPFFIFYSILLLIFIGIRKSFLSA